MIQQCEEIACSRKAKFQHREKWYCSDFCAEVASKTGHKSSTSDDVTDAFSTPADGEASVPSKLAGNPKPLETKQTEARSVNSKKETTNEIPKDAEENGANERLDDELAMATRYESKSESEPFDETLPPDSAISLQGFGEARPEQMNLLDSSIRQLYGLMVDVASDVRKKSRPGIESYIDSKTVNAACNCAKQMASLLKLKIDFKKMEGGGK